MTSNNRTTNVARNTITTLIVEVLVLIVSFINRSLFIAFLGNDYLGLDGLFGSILTAFSLAELGIGSAILYGLYKPIAENDISKARQFFSLYKKAYNIIAMSILMLGLMMIPFIKRIVKTDVSPLGINLYAVYFLFLANSVSSYVLAYRSAVLGVNQRGDIISKCQLGIKVSVSFLECILLLAFKNYYLYLGVKIAGNYIQAFIISYFAKKKYPELCRDTRDKLTKEEIRIVKRNVGALFVRRVGGVVLAATDNIVINAYISLSTVGIYSNYILIVSSIQTISTKLIAAATSSIGNYVASNEKEESRILFNTYTFITYLVFGFCSVCLYVMSNRFITLLWGEAFLFSKICVFLICLNFFLHGFNLCIEEFRSTTGIFVQGKYQGFFSAIINVVSSIILVKQIGIEGVVLGTIISRVLVSTWLNPFIIFKYFFKSSASYYYFKFVLYLCISVVTALAYEYGLRFIPNTIIGFVLCGFICISSGLVLVLPFVRTREFAFIVSKIKQLLYHRRGI